MRLLALILISLTLVAAEPPFKMPAAYACDISATADGQKVTGRLFYGGTDKQRMEMKAQGMDAVMIVRKDLKQILMLMPAQKMAMQMPYDPTQVPMQDPTNDPNAVFTKQGSETVNGVACDKYEWTSGAEKGTVWVDAKQNVMIRAVDAKTKGQADFSNYKIGAQDAALFEQPQGYQVMQMPGGPGMK